LIVKELLPITNYQSINKYPLYKVGYTKTKHTTLI